MTFCCISFTQIFDVEKKVRGSHLLELVMNHLELREREYFGLMFNDTGGVLPTGHSPDVMRWLDPQKPVRKQMRTAISGVGSRAMPTLYLRVKFYVTGELFVPLSVRLLVAELQTEHFAALSDPTRLHEEFTRYHLFLQVRRDLVDRRLSAPMSTLSLLTSYALQSVVGDYDDDNPENFDSVSDLRKLCHLQTASPDGGPCAEPPLPPEEIDRRITELHKLHRNQSPAEAELNFLEHAKRLETYGISLHSGKDSSGRDIQLGVTSAGLVVFQNSLKINTFSWSKIVKISFKRKQFFIQLRKELTENYDTLLGFNLASYRSCKNLWKSAVEHHSFFRLHSPKAAPHRMSLLMNLGSKFRYSGRTGVQGQQQHPQDGGKGGSCKSLTRMTPNRKTLPLSVESGKKEGKSRVPRYVTRKRLDAAMFFRNSLCRLASPETSSIGSSVHSNGSVLRPLSKPPTAPPLSSALGGGGASSGSGSNSTVSLAHRAIESFNNKVQSLSTKLPKKAWQDEITSDDDGELQLQTLDQVNTKVIRGLGSCTNGLRK